MQGFREALARVCRGIPEADGVDFERLVHEIHRASLRRALEMGEQLQAPSADELATLRRLALYLESETLIATDRDEQSFQDALYVSASVFELLGTYDGAKIKEGDPRVPLHRRLSSGDLADLFRSLILYSLGRHEANCAVMGRRLVASLNDITADQSLAERTIRTGLDIIVSLLSRNLLQAVAQGGMLGVLASQMRREWRHSAFPVEEALFLAAWMELAEGAAAVAAGLLTGVPRVMARGQERIARATDRAARMGHAFAAWAADKLSIIVDDMISRSVYSLLGDSGLPFQYLRLLATTGSAELWSSQQAAIRAGLLHSDSHYVVNLPTGAGKSLLAELTIVRAIANRKDAWAVYVVPTRALVNQVEQDLRRRLPRIGIWVRTVLAGVEPALILDAEAAELAAPRTVTILTPEKLDVYFRNRPEIFSSCRLLIVDEAHKLNDDRRGSLLDTLLTRFRILVPNARILLLSAMLTNYLEISAWLDNPHGGIQSQWRPTRQLRGFALAHDLKQSIEVRKYGGITRRVRVVDYHGGVYLADTRSDLLQLRTVDLPRLFTGRVRRWFDGRGKRRRNGPSAIDHAIDVAVRFMRLRGVVVVFVPSKVSAEKCAREIALRLGSTTEARPPREFVRHLELILGKDHRLIELVQMGIAYHHADLPRAARRAIESALRSGALRAISATATLREGLNTPATTVIIAGAYQYNQEANESQPMSIADFSNIAGRAGRAGRDTEGHVILVPSQLEDGPNAVLSDAGEYLFPPHDALVVRSAFEAIVRELQNDGDSIDQPPVLSNAAQTALLALEAAGLASEEGLSRFFSTTLAVFQRRGDGSRAARAADRYLRDVRDRIGADRLQRYARTALSFDDCTTLDAALSSLIETGYDVSSSLRTARRIDSERLRPLVAALLQVPQLRSRTFRGENAVGIAAEVLARWIGGATYPELAKLEPFGGSVESVVRYLSAIANELAWGLGAAYLILDALAPEQVHREFGLLPLYAEFGVDEPAAAYLSLLGVTDRQAATALSHLFIQDTDTEFPAFEDVEHWARSLTAQRVRAIVASSEFRARILLEDLGLGMENEVGGGWGQRSIIVSVQLDASLPFDSSSLLGEFCDFRSSPNGSGSIVAIERMSRRRWGLVMNARALREAAHGEIFRLLGVATDVDRERTLRIHVWLP